MDELFPPQSSPQAQQASRSRVTQAGVAAAATADLARQLTGVATRLRLAEERYANLQKRNRLTEETLLEFERELSAELRATLQQVTDLRRRISDIDQKVNAIQGELGGFVRKHEFAVVERYLDLWQPVRFLSQDEAKRMIAQALKARDTPTTPGGAGARDA